MLNKKILLLVLILGISSSIKSQEPVQISELKKRIDNYMKASLKHGYSASVLVAINGKPILEKGYGKIDRKSLKEITPNTVFNIGSITKQFTAAAILKLQEQSKLNTSDSLGTFFNNLPNDKREITLHQLLTHTSGISPRTGGFRYHEASQSEFMKDFIDTPLANQPGSKHQYANANYILLALVIEKVTRDFFEKYLQTNFWKPLKMHHTFYQDIPKEHEYAKGYYFNYTEGMWKDWGSTKEHLPKTNRYWYSVGKGDVSSTTKDLFRWHIALQNNEVLSPSSKQMLETPFVAENTNKTSYYGYGWAIYTDKNENKIVTHNGSNGIYFADFIRAIHKDIVVIVLSNIRLNEASENTAWTIYKMTTDRNYNPTPILKNDYELVFDFMKNHHPLDISQLPSYMKENTSKSFMNKGLLNRIGYAQVTQRNNNKWGIALLTLNTQLFPNDGNLFDTLGEAYYHIGDRKNAKSSFEKALDLKPEENCYWCENARKKLELLNKN
jgi:CubicO group peptidase (beta-lactamase class C family)